MEDGLDAGTDPEGFRTPARVRNLEDVVNLRCDERLDGRRLSASCSPGPRPRVVRGVPRRPAREIVPSPGRLDRALLEDARVLKNMLRQEEAAVPSVPDYFAAVQTEVRPGMRKIVADWLLEVSQEVGCEPEVFCYSVSYMDKFLSKKAVPKSALQLVGAVCLFLSSKFLESQPIPGEKIVYYTDFSITTSELRQCELLVLDILQWELSLVSPLDFLEQIISKIGLSSHVDLFDVRRRTETMICLAMTNYEFAYVKPSLLASATLLIILKNYSEAQMVKVVDSVEGFDEVSDMLLNVCKVKREDVENITQLLTNLIPPYVYTFPQLKQEHEQHPQLTPPNSSPTYTASSLSPSPSSQSGASSPMTSSLAGEFEANLKHDLSETYVQHPCQINAF